MRNLLENIPFIAASTAVAPKVSTQRIVEAVIIGLISAGMSTYITTKVLEEKASQIDRRLSRVEEKVDRQYESLQGDLRRLYGIIIEDRARGRTTR